MGVDRGQLKRATSTSDHEGEPLESATAPRTPCRVHGRENAAGGSGKPWPNQAAYLEVTRSPSYLKGTAGLVLSPARAEEPAAAQPPTPAFACSPSSTTVMKSPPAPVRAGRGRPTKPKTQASGVPRTPAGSGAGAGGAVPGGHGLLPPPAIQREARSGFLKGGKSRSTDSAGSGGGRSTGGVRMAGRLPASRRHSPVPPQLFIFGASSSSSSGGGGGGGGGGSGSGSEAGGPCPQTPGSGPQAQAPSTTGAEGRLEEASGGDAEHLSEAQGMALPAMPTVTRDPETPGFASIPGICSPPIPCHRGTDFGGGGQRAGGRLRVGVGVDEGVDDVCFAGGGCPPTAGGDARGGCGLCAADGDGGLSRGSGEISGSSRCGDEAGRCSGSGGDTGGDGAPLGCRGGRRRRQGRGRSSSGSGGRDFHACGGMMGSGSRAEGSPERVASPSTWSGAHDTERTGRPTRREQLLDASSAERFSEDLDEAGEAWVGAAGRGISRRSGRGARKPVDEGEGETLIDFRGRMAAVASATRLCLAAGATAAPAIASTSVLATPPHPIPAATSAPPLPRRRLMMTASPKLQPPPPAAATAPAGEDEYGDGDGLPPGPRNDAANGNGNGNVNGNYSYTGGGGAISSNANAGDAGASRSSCSSCPASASSAASLASASLASAWTTPARRGKSQLEGGAGGGSGVGRASAAVNVSRETPTPATGGGHRGGGWRGRGRGLGRLALDPLAVALRPSEMTAPKTRPWPGFDGIRYDPPESKITTPLRRSDWVVPHGSAMQALAAALNEAAGSAACSSPLDMREERRRSIRQRYRERAEHFRLIQAARESSACKGSAMLAVMRQKRQAEEDERRARELREAREARLKEKMLMRMLEGRRRVFRAWARRAVLCRKAREMLQSREASRQLRLLLAWREEARRARRAREFVIEQVSGSKRATFMTWRSSARKSAAAKKMALAHLRGSQKACFCAWRDTTRGNVRRRELAIKQSALARSALSGLAGARCRFVRWKAWAARGAAAKRMSRRTRQAGLRRCFLALANIQLKLRRRLEERRAAALAAAFRGWRVGLGRLLRARLLPAEGDDDDSQGDGGGDRGKRVTGGGGGGGRVAGECDSAVVVKVPDRSAPISSARSQGWGFAPPAPERLAGLEGDAEKVEDREQSRQGEERPPACTASRLGGGEAGGGDDGEGDGGAVGAWAGGCEREAASPNWDARPVVLLPPSAFFVSASCAVTGVLVPSPQVTVPLPTREVGGASEEAASVAAKGAGGEDVVGGSRGASRSGRRRRRKRRKEDGGDSGGDKRAGK